MLKVPVMCPKCTGETLIEHLREAAIAVPVVLASVSADITLLAGGLGVEHVSKPYDVSALEETLARLSRRSRTNNDSRC